MNKDLYGQAAGTVLSLLPRDRPPTLEEIRIMSLQVAQILKVTGKGEIEPSILALQLEYITDIFDGEVTVLEDKKDHAPWLPNRRAEIHWSFWDRYKRWLVEERHFAPTVVGRLENSIDEVLGRLEDPTRPGPWDRRGMVVGQVQSGKTSNYTGLICRAADAGYRLIVVLAGMHDSLRAQTQLRLDEGFLGFDTQRRMLEGSTHRIGVGARPGALMLPAHALTNSATNGDFNVRVATTANVNVHSQDPVLLVIKKNTRILKNLIDWLSAFAADDPRLGRRAITGVPLLVIDDEADNASINTKAIPRDENGQALDEYSPTKTNERIRELLRIFDRAAYVGYTATPFANVFISPSAKTERLGEDLFPRSFIINLDPPSNYVGPVKIFGLPSDPDDDGAKELIKAVEDTDDWIDPKLKGAAPPAPLPHSLQQAIDAFLLATAARRVRDQHDHNSMLVHVTRYTIVQAWVTDRVREYVRQVRDSFDMDGPGGEARERLRGRWEDDFMRTTSLMGESPSDWTALARELPATLSSIEVRTLNGTAKDVLDYLEHRDQGLNVIAIGGDKLARGLTLEGLTVSYFLRVSRMYDTLMQMGRWFGYRPDYLDLCRLYLTEDLQKWYEHITAASEELREEFRHMVKAGMTPERYGLRVKTHPDGLHITASNKLRTAETVQISYSGSISETIGFSREPRRLEQNMRALDVLLSRLGEPAREPSDEKLPGNYVWSASAIDVIAFLEAIHTDPSAVKAQSAPLAEYIADRERAGKLGEWTVVLVDRHRPNATHELPGLPRPLGLTEREDQSEGDRDRCTIKRLLSPTDERLDLTPEERRDAGEGARGPDGKALTPSGRRYREQRQDTRGLLLVYVVAPKRKMEGERQEELTGAGPFVGFGISFPFDAGAKPVKYRVNEVYWSTLVSDA